MKTSPRFIAILLFAAVLLTACGQPAAAAPIVPEGTVPAGTQPGQLTGLAGCEYQPQGGKLKYPAECGALTVSENWDKASSRLIALPVVRIKASGSQPSEPVFWLEGGPGGSNFTYSPPDWLLQKHDVVIVGYRGVEGSVVLSCPEVSERMKAHLGRDLWSEQAEAELVTASKQCAARLQATGTDLSAYTIPAVVEDMEAARTAFRYSSVDLLSVSYGTRVAQIYAYRHPERIHRSAMVALNTPGHFLYDPAVLDKMIAHLGELCAKDAACSSRTTDLAQAIYTVNHNMPKRWLVFPIDPDTIRLGSHFLLAANQNVGTVADVYLAAAQGDPSGLALANLVTSTSAPLGATVYGELFSIGASTDLEKYHGIESISLGNSILGAPIAEWTWGMAAEWPITMIPKELREFQESDVDMLLVNGTIDFATPPTALEEAKPYWHKAQFVLLPEMSHVSDVINLQPAAWQRLLTSYYDTGVADSSLYVYQPVSFKPGMNLPMLAKLLAAAMIIVPALIVLIIVLVVRRIGRRASAR
jgi:pimeloyl-ACP methyl ester carboxylesterase